MLRSEHLIASYDFENRRVYPDRLRRGTDACWLMAAEEIIRVYRQGIGECRQVLHRQVAEQLEELPGCVPRRVTAFCKLLDDASAYRKAAGDAASLRKRVFESAAEMHPIVEMKEGIFEHSIDQARATICHQLGLDWEAIADGMFADVIELQRLREFDEKLQAGQLLSRYNVAQTQALLYKATAVRLDFSPRAPFIVRRAKLAGLMHRIERFEKPDGPSYTMILDGPGSVLRDTSRYGIRFAQLIPSLLCCEGWRLRAKLRSPSRHDERPFRFQLSPADGLRGEQNEPDEFDSELERAIERRWRDAPEPGWSLHRDREFLTLGQQVYTPDFVLQEHKTRRRIFIEVLGFWTPEYLRDKHERLRKFSAATPGTGWLLMMDKKPTAVKQQLLDDLSLPVIVLKKSVQPKDWITAAC
ncbi:MAG: DUF790 family protein [Planctomycetota bacterium]